MYIGVYESATIWASGREREVAGYARHHHCVVSSMDFEDKVDNYAPNTVGHNATMYTPRDGCFLCAWMKARSCGRVARCATRK
jgi:hypothetical protein